MAVSRSFALSVLLIAAAAVGGALVLLSRATPTEPGHPAEPNAEPVPELDLRLAIPSFTELDQNYYRGAEPGADGISLLKRLGVKSIVDLRSEYERSSQIEDRCKSDGLDYHWIPMSVWEPPSDEIARRFVSLVLDETKGPFFVFCDDGIHRTGEMSAIYRIEHHGWDVKQALEEMDELGFKSFYISLRNYVWTYSRKFKPSAVPKGARRLSPLEKLLD